MKPWTWRNTLTEAKLLLIGIPLFLWTMIPVYHLVLFAISPRDTATSGRLWPKEPTLQNFNFVFYQKHFYLDYFWIQLGNSVLIATAVAFLTLVISTFAAFAIISCGIGFFTGKISWGLMIGITAGIAAMFGAPTIVAAIAGGNALDCAAS
jgi:ABC-type maltose transport system permease subunit